MLNEIPAGVQSAFERTEHPFYMWEGMQDLPMAARDILSPSIQERIQRSAHALQGKRSIDLIGCGTSYFAGIAATYVFHALTPLTAHAFNAFEYLAYPPQASDESVLIGISHTGGTPAVIQALDMAKQRGELTIGYTDVENSALDRVADHTIYSSLGAEPALPKTRSYVAALLRNACLAVTLARLQGKDVADLETQLAAVPQKLAQVMAEVQDQARTLAKTLKEGRKFIVVGGGPQWATAQEGALKLTEAARVVADAWELEEAVHGTWASTQTGDVVIILAMEGPSYEKSAILAEGMKTIGATVWAITNKQGAQLHADHLTVLPNDLDELFMPLTAILPLYYYTYFLALELGVRPDNMNLADPRYLKARQMMRTSMK
jgi:glucosamine--fructose-6-phosphate aminotransferase (isomerizing)